MGQLLPWPPKEGRAARPSPEGDEPRGQILFFLGVRYERHPEPGQAGRAGQDPGGRPATSRKRRRG